MGASIHIRPARPADAKRAAVLLYAAYTHTHVTYPLGDEQEHSWIKHLLRSFRQGDNRFSYQNIQVAVAEPGSQVVGLVLSFGGREEPQLNAATGPWLEREARDDEWYIDALAVLDNWTRQGIGTRLLHIAEEQARAHHYTKVALNVAQDNKEALSLYTHQHYVVTGQTTLYQRPYARMVKTLNNP